MERWAEIIDSMLDIFKPPLSIRLINVVRGTLSFPFQTKEYNKVCIFLINSFLFEIRTTLYKIFGMAKDLITWIFPSSVSPLKLQPFNNPLRDFSIDSESRMRYLPSSSDRVDFNLKSTDFRTRMATPRLWLER